ncbi:MAG: aminotransferase class V-fold PLP-dependent enzyme, partial [Fulvivirga sp.]|nr:aminotransferase class V-fold PLP-dependent enzyme [Fulvivirga sp.]
MLKNQSALFNLSQSITYLNCAYMSPLLKTVEQVGIDGIKKKRNPVDVKPDDFFTDTEELRKTFGKIINTHAYERIVIIPSVSYGMANVVKNVKLDAKDEVVVLGEQFPSNYYPWQSACKEQGARLITVSPPKTLENRGKRWNEKILEAINNHTKIVAL